MQKKKIVVTKIDALEAREALVRNDTIFIDVREEHEWKTGYIPGATHIPVGCLELDAPTALQNTARPIICYCAHGQRSLAAGKTLITMGYTNVSSLAGGTEAWLGAGLGLETTHSLSAAEMDRYDRQVRLKKFGPKRQQRLLQSRVLIVGAGGLGCPAALYLAGAGVGEIGIIDSDVVEISNLQRQIGHRSADVGTPKVDSLARTAGALNPDIQIQCYPEALTVDNALMYCEQYDVIIDGCDNLPTRYVINDACCQTGTPFVHGSVQEFTGFVTSFNPPAGTCYRCLYPKAPAPHECPTCVEAGVLGPVPGIIGLMQAMEAIKILTDCGQPSYGRLQQYDALMTQWRSIEFSRDPDCCYCGPGAAVPGIGFDPAQVV